jgi:hypothetical protein
MPATLSRVGSGPREALAVTYRHGEWVHRLHAESAVPDAPACSAMAIAAATAQLGAAPVDWAVAQACELAAESVRAFPEFGGGPAQLLTVRRGVESATLGFLIAISTGRANAADLNADTVATIDEYVHRRIPLDRIWAVLRHGQAWLSECLLAACAELAPPAHRIADLQHTAAMLFRFNEWFTGGFSNHYLAEHERWLASTNATREETIRAVLAGSETDATTAAARLRYDMAHRHHLAVVAWRDTADTESASATELQREAVAFLQRAGARQTVVYPQGAALLWAWGNREVAFAADTGGDGAALPPGTSIAVGLPLVGIAGFRDSHQQAREAQRVGLLPGLAGTRLVRYSTVSLLALLTSSPPLAVEFVTRQLGGLARQDQHTVELRRTLLAYLELRSPQAAAERLLVARNTVKYRVKQAEEMLGHRVTDARVHELTAALLLADAMTASFPPAKKGSPQR